MCKGIAIIILLMLQSCSSQPIKVNADRINMPVLRSELLDMEKSDQDIRFELNNKKSMHSWDKTEISEMADIDTINTQRVKQIINVHGWLQVEDIGRDGLNALWIILQHSSDYDFQEKSKSTFCKIL